MEKVKRIFVVVFVAAFSFACREKETLTVAGPSESDFRIVDGRVTFTDPTSAQRYLTSLSSKSDDALGQWEKDHNFVSLRSGIKALEKTDTMLSYFPRALATVLNENREYRVGNDIFWFHNNSIFTIPEGNEKLLLEVKRSPEKSEFSPLRKNFIEFYSVVDAARNGRVINGFANYTSPFALAGSHNFRFTRTVYSVGMGTYYVVQFQNYLQYQSTRNGAWYLAGETVPFRSIGNVVAVSDASNDWQYNEFYKKLDYANGTLKLDAIKSTLRFSGRVTATFEHKIYSAIYQSEVSFYDNVTFQ
ncbi:MAG TPA: hypothetical protein VIU12_06070 [Chryseolinea sp.]